MGVSVEGMWREAAHPGDTEIQSPPAQSEAEPTLLCGSLLRGHRISFLAGAVQGKVPGATLPPQGATERSYPHLDSATTLVASFSKPPFPTKGTDGLELY